MRRSVALVCTGVVLASLGAGLARPAKPSPTRLPSDAGGLNRRQATRTPRWALGAILAAGVVLRLWQYLANGSLWVDEAAVARNLLERPFTALFTPLDFGQTAPWGFLLAEKAAIAALGNTEYVLRLLPFLCGLASLFLFYVAARRILNGFGLWVSQAMFASALPFVYFPSQVKPYSGDVAAGLIVLLLGLRAAAGTTRTRAIGIGLAGAVLPWFSYASVFVLGGVGAGLLLARVWRPAGDPGARESGPGARAAPVGRAVIIAGLWAVSAGIAVLAARHSMTSADRLFMQRFWASGFAPFPPRSADDLLWPWRRVVGAFGVFSVFPDTLDGGLHYRLPLLFAVLGVAGMLSTWRRNRATALFLMLPVLLSLAAAEAHLYPFSGRVAIFLIPFLILAAAAAIDDLQTFVIWAAPAARFVLPAGLTLIVVQPIVRNHPPSVPEDVKTLAAYVGRHRDASDAVYAYYGAGQAFLYYMTRGDFQADFPPGTYTVGSCSRRDPRAYLRELDQFRGRRLWTLFAHSLQQEKELRLMTAYLDWIGQLRETVTAAGAYVFLYDLTDPRRLASASAETFPVPAGDTEKPWLCYGTMTPMKAGTFPDGRAAPVNAAAEANAP